MITKKPLLMLLFLLIAFNFSWSQESNSNSNSASNTTLDSLDIARMPPPPQFSLITFGYDAAGNQIRRSFCNNSIECDFSRQSMENAKEVEQNDALKENVSSLMIYPNPTSGVLTLKSTSTTNLKLITAYSVYATDGILVLNFKDPKGFENREIDLSQSASGVYFIHIHFKDNSNTTIKIIKK